MKTSHKWDQKQSQITNQSKQKQKYLKWQGKSTSYWHSDWLKIWWVVRFWVYIWATHTHCCVLQTNQDAFVTDLFGAANKLVRNLYGYISNNKNQSKWIQNNRRTESKLTDFSVRPHRNNFHRKHWHGTKFIDTEFQVKQSERMQERKAECVCDKVTKWNGQTNTCSVQIYIYKYKHTDK